MDNLKLLKSVVFRTKSFKALLLGGLIIGCIVTQYPSASNKLKTEIDKEEFIPLIEPSTIIPVKKADIITNEVIDGQYFMSNKDLISTNYHKFSYQHFHATSVGKNEINILVEIH